MSDIAALPEAQSEDLAPFLSGEQKQEIIDQQFGFMITAARPHVPSSQPQFKDQTMFEIAFFVPGALTYLEQQGKADAAANTVKTFSGESVPASCPGWASNARRWMLALQHNGTREGQAKKIAELLALGHPMVGPSWLNERPNDTPGFNPTRIITGSPKPVVAKAKKTNGNGAATPQAAPDEADGIPFVNDSTFRVTL